MRGMCNDSAPLTGGVAHAVPVPDADFESLVADTEATIATDTFDEEGVGADMETVGRVFHQPPYVAEDTDGEGA